MSLGRDGIQLAFRNTKLLDNARCMLDLMHLHDKIRMTRRVQCEGA